jgi:hypothetical protein
LRKDRSDRPFAFEKWDASLCKPQLPMTSKLIQVGNKMFGLFWACGFVFGNVGPIISNRTSELGLSHIEIVP